MGTSYNPKIVTDGLVLNLDPANVKSYPAKEDPFVNNVSLMLDFNQDFTDKSINSSTVVSNGSAAISSIQSKFGNYSGSFTNSNSYLQIANSSLFNLTSSNFTIEAWVYPTTSSGDRVIVAKNQGSYLTGYEWWFGINNNNTVAFTFTDSNTTFYSAGTVTTVSANTWTHIAAVRSGNTVTVYINGVSSATVGAQTVKTTASDVSIARDLETTGGGGRYYTGYIDDLRITKVARYTANFAPPTAPLSLPGRLTDLTKNKLNTTLISGPTYSGGSLVFDGSTQYINIGSNSNLILGTNNFALELWFKPIARLQSYPFLLHNQVGGGGFTTNCWQINDRHGNNPTLVTFWNYNYNAGSSAMLASTSIANGNWYHLVITRIGNLFSMYLNSILQSTVTSSISMDNGVAKNYGFNTTGGGGFNGNASSIKIYNNKGLTAAEVFQNYNATKGRFR